MPGQPRASRPGAHGRHGPVAGKPRSVSLVTGPSLDDITVEWALAAVGGDRLVSSAGLREGGPPWLMRYEASGTDASGSIPRTLNA